MDGISEGGTTPLISKSLGASAVGQKKIVKLLMPAEGDNAGLDIKVSMILACESLFLACFTFEKA